MLNGGGEAVYAPSEVGIATGKIDMLRLSKIPQHRLFIARRVLAITASSAPLWISRVPKIKVL